MLDAGIGWCLFALPSVWHCCSAVSFGSVFWLCHSALSLGICLAVPVGSVMWQFSLLGIIIGAVHFGGRMGSATWLDHWVVLIVTPIGQWMVLGSAMHLAIVVYLCMVGPHCLAVCQHQRCWLLCGWQCCHGCI